MFIALCMSLYNGLPDFVVIRRSATELQYNTIQYKTYNAPYVTKMLFVGGQIITNLLLTSGLVTQAERKRTGHEIQLKSHKVVIFRLFEQKPSLDP